MNWKCKHTWKKARTNTMWCLLGCSIGDFGTIFYFQNIDHNWLTFEVMSLAIVNGLLTSIILETIILLKQMNFTNALKSCVLTEIEIELWESGNEFEDPWPKNIVRLIN